MGHTLKSARRRVDQDQRKARKAILQRVRVEKYVLCKQGYCNKDRAYQDKALDAGSQDGTQDPRRQARSIAKKDRRNDRRSKQGKGRYMDTLEWNIQLC